METGHHLYFAPNNTIFRIDQITNGGFFFFFFFAYLSAAEKKSFGLGGGVGRKSITLAPQVKNL